jgi:hypothetical protein
MPGSRLTHLRAQVADLLLDCPQQRHRVVSRAHRRELFVEHLDRPLRCGLARLLGSRRRGLRLQGHSTMEDPTRRA